ncbi:MAG: hypothetical protein GY898_03115, partial [Proteobacteria bacterium]|nr:hypothetical protein [Pseudomonadota bacterium]
MPWNFRRSRSQVKKLEAGHFRSGVQGNWEQHVTLKPEPPSPDLRYPHPLDLLEENLGVELDGFLGADFWKVGCFTVSPARGKVVFGTVSQAVDIKLDLAESPLDGDNRPYATI